MLDEGSAQYRKFWTQLLDMARTRTNLHARTKPSNNWYIGTTRGGITYNYALRKDAAYVELWIDLGKDQAETNEVIFRALSAHKSEIEKAFGESLIWHRADGRSRAVQFFASRYGFDDRKRWPEIQEVLIDAMIRLEAACSCYLNLGKSQVLLAASTVVLEVTTARVSQLASAVPASVGAASTITTAANLKAGIMEFRQRWPGESDFHNRLYRELSDRNNTGKLTWARLVDELAGWKALRTSIPGHDKNWYLEHGEKPFQQMQVLASQIRSHHSGHDPDIIETNPQELCELFEIALAIKGTDCPMFASKLCHFLMPSAFPVADQGVLGISTVDGYWHYWHDGAEGWRLSSEKEALKVQLQSAMSTTPFAGYPWSAKITELCYSGARNQRH